VGTLTSSARNAVSWEKFLSTKDSMDCSGVIARH
jgi:hypothetical protein